ncbi:MULTISPECIES: FliA/WhiG family RNA polymerase sigma factor [unclassified Pseudonocardia]|uniref:FliA/WhiG family RNA polymerase sigma factor n=1 Tax=unclassified Pseudonocardia TaxID=2619320 RepID=UPI001CF6765E|nr:FliA/WhiG family RNA polymerase sigma factor [Pseudonocardia sp. ICBG601]
MTRRTLGPEASPTTSRRPDAFPTALATALDRRAAGADTPRAAVLGPVPDPPGHPRRGPLDATTGRPPAGAAPACIALVPATVRAPRDTPDGAPGHLNETVEPAVVPLWREFLATRAPAARRRLVEHHAPLVRGVGTKLAVRLPSSIELADLLQSGTFGLMEAVDRFDPARGIRFEAYAAQRVRGAMLDELRAQDWVPRTVRARSREVERAREAVQFRAGRPATDGELAAELGVAVRDLRQARRPMYLVSAEDLGAGGPAGSPLSTLPADDSVDPVTAAVRRETGAELRAAIGLLGERDRLVLRLYYVENRTLAEIGGVLGVTESRVCQLHARMITRLRATMEPALAG